VQRLLAGVDELSAWISELGRMPADGRETTLIDGLSHRHETVRAMAAYGLGLAGPRSEAAVRSLAAASTSACRSVRLCALFALSKVPADSPLVGSMVLPAIDERLGKDDWVVRRYAALAMAAFGQQAQPYLKSLAAALRAGDEELCHRAAYAMSLIGLPALEELMLPAMREFPLTQEAVLQAVRRLGRRAARTTPTLVELARQDLRDGGRNAWAFCAALENMGPSGISALLDLAGQPANLDYALGYWLIPALGRAADGQDERVLTFLEAVIGMQTSLREPAVEALQKLNPERAKELGLPNKS
jgi:HEAT repeat protein